MKDANLNERLTSALSLTVPPLAITFSDEPVGASTPDAPVPAGCSFWELGTKQSLTTSAADHQFCPIGVHTHNLRDAMASHGTELETALGAMTGLGYVKPDEVAGIPVMSESYAYVTYGPLADTKGSVSVVLVVADANRSLTLTEAVARVDGAAPLPWADQPVHWFRKLPTRAPPQRVSVAVAPERIWIRSPTASFCGDFRASGSRPTSRPSKSSPRRTPS